MLSPPATAPLLDNSALSSDLSARSSWSSISIASAPATSIPANIPPCTALEEILNDSDASLVIHLHNLKRIVKDITSIINFEESETKHSSYECTARKIYHLPLFLTSTALGTGVGLVMHTIYKIDKLQCIQYGGISAFTSFIIFQIIALKYLHRQAIKDRQPSTGHLLLKKIIDSIRNKLALQIETTTQANLEQELEIYIQNIDTMPINQCIEELEPLIQRLIHGIQERMSVSSTSSSLSLIPE